MTPDKTADESRRVVRPTDARRGEIVRAALAILQEEGAAGVTARALAARSGLALGQVSYHFPSMAEVLSETYRAASAELAAATLSEIAAADTSAEHRLRAFLGAGFRPAGIRIWPTPKRRSMTLTALRSAAISAPLPMRPAATARPYPRRVMRSWRFLTGSGSMS
jgi:AcrR family transcriptional regulator